MRMFFGVSSWRSGSCTCMRRQRLRSAIATARLAASWPMMCLSSSWTICRGVSAEDMCLLGLPALGCVQLLDAEGGFGVDAYVGGNAERAPTDFARAQGRSLEQPPCGGERVLAAGADRRDVVI